MAIETLSDLTRYRAHERALADDADYIMCRALKRPATEWPDRHAKAAVDAMSTTDPSVLGDPLAVFRDTIIAPSVAAQLPALRAPVNQPIPRDSGEGTGYWTEQGAARPLTRFNFEPVTLADHQLSVMFGLTRRVMRVGDPLARNLTIARGTRVTTRALDTALLGTTAATAAQPAGLLNGVVGLAGGSPVSGSSVEELVAIVSDGRPTFPVFVCSARAAAYLATLSGNAFRDVRMTGRGSILGAPQLVSPAAGANLILIDAAELAINLGRLEVDSSGEAAIEMSDTPSGNSVTGTGASMVSLWQTDTVAVRLTINATWAVLSDDAVGYLTLDAIGNSPA